MHFRWFHRHTPRSNQLLDPVFAQANCSSALLFREPTESRVCTGQLLEFDPFYPVNVYDADCCLSCFEDRAHVFVVGIGVSPSAHAETTALRVLQRLIHLCVGDVFKLDTRLFEDAVPCQLLRTDIVGGIDFVVALLSHQQLMLDIEPIVESTACLAGFMQMVR